MFAQRAAQILANHTLPDTVEAEPASTEVLIARYLTLAGEALQRADLTIDVVQHTATRYTAVCRGCDYTWSGSFPDSVRDRAEGHAETCRALPVTEA